MLHARLGFTVLMCVCVTGGRGPYLGYPGYPYLGYTAGLCAGTASRKAHCQAAGRQTARQQAGGMGGRATRAVSAMSTGESSEGPFLQLCPLFLSKHAHTYTYMHMYTHMRITDTHASHAAPAFSTAVCPAQSHPRGRTTIDTTLHVYMVFYLSDSFFCYYLLLSWTLL